MLGHPELLTLQSRALRLFRKTISLVTRRRMKKLPESGKAQGCSTGLQATHEGVKRRSFIWVLPGDTGEGGFMGVELELVRKGPLSWNQGT